MMKNAVPEWKGPRARREPAKRDTAAAVALGVGWVARKNPNATMAVLPADHLIQDVAEYQKVLGTAIEIAAKSPSLVTIGIKPTRPCPSYGYIERGPRAENHDAILIANRAEADNIKNLVDVVPDELK
jgi:mannose-1-phosphate guanylyltransferase